MEEAIRVHLGQEEQGDGQEEERKEDDMDVDVHEHQEHQQTHDESQEDDGEDDHDEEDNEASESECQPGDESEPEESLARERDGHETQRRRQIGVTVEATSSPGLGTRVKGFLYSYLRPSSAASNLKSTSTSVSTLTTTARMVSTTSVASSSRKGSGTSIQMGPAARARAQAQAQVRAKPTTKPSARATTTKQPTSKPILRKGLPMQPPAVLEARAKARTRVTRPVVTPARPPPVKPPHPKDVVQLHPPLSLSTHQQSSNSNPVHLNTITTNGKARQIPVPIPRDLVRLNHVPPPIEKPVVDRTGSVNDRPGRPRSSAGSSVKDLVGVFEEMEREAAGSRAGFRAVGGAPVSVFAKDARAREAARKWRAETRDTRPRWR